VLTARLKVLNKLISKQIYKIVSPNNMLQVYTINVLILRSSVSCAFILMQNKQFETYNRALHVIIFFLNKKNCFKALSLHVNTPPLTVMMDFELAAKNSFMLNFQMVQSRFCLFHLSQAINRRVSSRGLINLYRQNNDYKIYVRSLAALSFLPLVRVEYAFYLLRQRATNLIIPQEFINFWDEALDIFGYFQTFFLFYFYFFLVFLERMLFDKITILHYIRLKLGIIIKVL
jgi:hypothetical protein